MSQPKYIPLSFIFEHQAMLGAMAKIALGSKTKPKNPQIDSLEDLPAIKKIIPAPHRKLVDAYIAWSGAPVSRYIETLPPHMVSQWGLSIATELLLQTPFNLVNVINQGTTFKIYGDLPRNQELLVNVGFDSVSDQDGLARLNIKITTGTLEQPILVDALMHMSFILPHYQKKKKTHAIDSKKWESIGTWKTSPHDGLKFALLTGDFNPIHWIGLAGKLSSFKMKVLHGFGMLVRTYELLPQPIKHFDVRFLRPVPLPSQPLDVQVVTSTELSKPFRLIDPTGVQHLLGAFEN